MSPPSMDPNLRLTSRPSSTANRATTVATAKKQQCTEPRMDAHARKRTRLVGFKGLLLSELNECKSKSQGSLVVTKSNRDGQRCKQSFRSGSKDCVELLI